MINIIKILEGKLAKYKNILEISSKEGKDLEILDAYYEVVASEDEKIKTRYLKDKYIDIRVILLEAVAVDTHKKFECIFSRNVLDRLSLEDLKTSLENQKNILEGESLIFHIFDKNRVSKNEIENIVSKNYEILESKIEDENFYILAKMT